MSCGTTQCVKEEMYTNSSGYTKRERVIQLKFQKNKTKHFFFLLYYGYYNILKNILYYFFIFLKSLIN